MKSVVGGEGALKLVAESGLYLGEGLDMGRIFRIWVLRKAWHGFGMFGRFIIESLYEAL